MARPKQTVAIGKESSSIKRVKTCSWPNGKSEPINSASTSSHEGDEPSIETSESGGHPETWLEDALLNGDFEVDKAVPQSPQEEEDCVVLKSVATNADLVRGLDAGHVKSAPAPSDIYFTGAQNGSKLAMAARGFDCTTCGKKFFSAWDIQEHPHLGVGICRGCRNFLYSSPYTKDTVDGSDEQCRWCGEGGRIIMCDSCDKVFCEHCIIRNFGPKDLHEIVTSIHWSCFGCNPLRLRDHVNEFKQFKKSIHSEGRFPVRRRGAADSGGKSCATRNAINIPGMVHGEGPTIAELLAQEEERRKQNPGEWIKPIRKRARKSAEVSASRKKAAISPEAMLSKHSTARAQVRIIPKKKIRQSTGSPAAITDSVKQAAVPSPPTYIRPHQWEEKRQQAAERRKRAAEAAEAERLNNATNLRPSDGLKSNENDSNAQAKGAPFLHIHRNGDQELVHLGHRRGDFGKRQMGGGISQVNPNERKVEKTIFFPKGRSGRDLMQPSDNAFGETPRNLLANFKGVSKK